MLRLTKLGEVIVLLLYLFRQGIDTVFWEILDYPASFS